MRSAGITVSAPGSYQFHCTSGSLMSYDVTDYFDTIPQNQGGGNMCFSAGPSIALKFVNVPSSVTMNSPTNIQVSGMDNVGCNDTTFIGGVTISKLNGPGNVTGNLTGNANHGSAFFIFNLISRYLSVTGNFGRFDERHLINYHSWKRRWWWWNVFECRSFCRSFVCKYSG
ncbi:MAG: hypothetical protein IPP51_13385 [Bacteroidetes bacterium]|nr:hypothetical protein [Bacteroidota bacterium]